MISKLAHMKNAVEGLPLCLAAHVDEVNNPPRPQVEPDIPPKVIRPSSNRLLGDQPDLTGLLQSSGGRSRTKSLEEVRRAQAIRDTYPLLEQKIRDGGLSAAHVDVLNRQIPAELIAWARSEEHLLLARVLVETIDRFTETVRAWVFQHAPTRAQKQAKSAARSEKLCVSLVRREGAAGTFHIPRSWSTFRWLHSFKMTRCFPDSIGRQPSWQWPLGQRRLNQQTSHQQTSMNRILMFGFFRQVIQLRRRIIIELPMIASQPIVEAASRCRGATPRGMQPLAWPH